MSLIVGGLDLQALGDGYYFSLIYGGPIDGVAEVSGQRVLIPGRPGYYTTDDAFEERHLVIGLKGIVQGAGSSHAAIQASLETRFLVLRTACGVASRQDVTIEADSHTISAGFLRFEGPTLMVTDREAKLDLLIEFDATNPPVWDQAPESVESSGGGGGVEPTPGSFVITLDGSQVIANTSDLVEV